MNDVDSAWLAGFLDGEGSFMVTRYWNKHCSAPTYDAVIAATNTDRRLVDRCKALCGGRIVTTPAKSSRWKDAHIWQLRGPAVGPVVKAVLPHLTGKKEQAEAILRLRNITKLGSPSGRFGTRKTPDEVAEREDLYNLVRSLNARGRESQAECAEMSRKRLTKDAPLFAEVT